MRQHDLAAQQEISVLAAFVVASTLLTITTS
jgi:hypothetical protein